MAAEAGSPDLQTSSLTALKSAYQSWAWTCKLELPALGACKKFTHFGPQITPYAKIKGRGATLA